MQLGAVPSVEKERTRLDCWLCAVRQAAACKSRRRIRQTSLGVYAFLITDDILLPLSQPNCPLDLISLNLSHLLRFVRLAEIFVIETVP